MSFKRVFVSLICSLPAILMITACSNCDDCSQTEGNPSQTSEESKEETVKMPDFEGENVSLNKPYTLSGKPGTGYGNYTGKLTDGKAHDKLTYDSNRFSFFNRSSQAEEEKNVENVSARYVKFEFKPNGLFVFINELEVYAK